MLKGAPKDETRLDGHDVHWRPVIDRLPELMHRVNSSTHLKEWLLE